MKHTMRWFGPHDPVSLMDIRQAGCSGVVTALHQVPVGEIWTDEKIKERIRAIESDNHKWLPLRWDVVESLPIHEDIKKGRPSRTQLIDNYKESLRNLAANGIKTVCYNFMPVLDWSRTDVNYLREDGSTTLRFVWVDFALFDLFILRRPRAENDYDAETREAAFRKQQSMTSHELAALQHTMLLGLPGSEESFELATFQGLLDEYREVSDEGLRENLYYFVRQVAPEADALGINLCIHPDDPPRPLLGLPRVVSTEADLGQLMEAMPVRSNGITFCTGSLGVREDNDLPGIVNRWGDRIHFAHLRAVRREADPRNFHEAPHLEGNAGMFETVKALLQEENRRRLREDADPQIPMRPDHGFRMMDDLNKNAYPGYTAIGRLKGLAELRGLETALKRILHPTDKQTG